MVDDIVNQKWRNKAKGGEAVNKGKSNYYDFMTK